MDLGTFIDLPKSFEQRYGAAIQQYATPLYTENHTLLKKISRKFNSVSSTWDIVLTNIHKNDQEISGHIDAADRNLRLAKENLLAPTDRSKIKQYEQAIFYARLTRKAIDEAVLVTQNLMVL